MFQKKAGAGLFLALLVFSFLSFASAFGVQKNPLNDVIIADFNQPAQFEFVVEGLPADYYQLYTLTDVALSPKGYFYIGGQKFNVSVYPTENLKTRGYYTFTYFFKQQDGESFEDKMTIKVVNLEDALGIESDYLDPNNNKITFYIENKENVQLKDIKARFSSALFDSEQVFSVDPYQRTEINIDVDQEKMKKAEAGSYIMSAEFYTDKGIKKVDGKIQLIAKQSIQTEESSSGILVHTDSVRKINNGNVPALVGINIKRNIFTRLFTTFDLQPSIIERKGLMVSYTWSRKLQPSESYGINAKTNFIFPFLTLILAVLIVIGFKRYTSSKVEVVKSVNYVQAKGGEFALKVRISVRARKSLHNVSLIDKIPAIAKVHEKFYGIEPTKIDSVNRRITWDIGDLNPGEERSFSYVIYSRVGVVGKFSLPEALLVFEKGGELHEVESNKVFFLSDQIRKEI